MDDFDALAAVADDLLVARINTMSRNVEPGVDFFYRELARRQTSRSADRMESMAGIVLDLTNNVVRLTKTITVLTYVAVLTSLAAVILSSICLGKS